MKKNLLLLFVTLVFMGLLLEIAFRLTRYHISYSERSSGFGYASPFKSRSYMGYGWDETPKPMSMQHINKIEFNYEWMSNNEGLRGDTISLQKKGKRVMVFGDSFTEGMGAPDDSTYPALLQNLIHAHLDSTAQVINCGPSGSDVFTEYKLFTTKMLKYKPDFVLVTFNSTDLYEFIVRGGFERFRPGNVVEYRKPPWFEPLYAKSYLARFIVHDVLDYDYRFLRPAEGKIMDELTITETCAAIDSFRLLCKANNCQFGMMFHPLLQEYTQSTSYPVQPIVAYCKKEHIPYSDDFDCLKSKGINKNNITTVYWPKDGHFNSQGYEILAQCAYELFVQHDWYNSSGK